MNGSADGRTVQKLGLWLSFELPLQMYLPTLCKTKVMILPMYGKYHHTNSENIRWVQFYAVLCWAIIFRRSFDIFLQMSVCVLLLFCICSNKIYKTACRWQQMSNLKGKFDSNGTKTKFHLDIFIPVLQYICLFL